MHPTALIEKTFIEDPIFQTIMHQYISFIIITIVSFLLAAFFIYQGVKAKRVNFIIAAVLCLIISIASIGWMAVLVYKSFSVINR